LKPPTEPNIRGAVVGAGHMGQYHVLALAELWGVDLVGVVDTDFERARRVAAPYGVRAFRDHRELAGEVDFATVAVPTERHFDVARELLEAGAHVLVEKPMTSTLEEAKELFQVARQRKRVLHVGHVERFNGAVQELRKIVERPILIESRRLGPFVPRVQSDSVVMDLMIHDIDIVLGLVDSEPRKMTAVGASVHSSVTDVATVQIVFDSGAMATITASRATEEKIRTLAITQPEAYIVLDYGTQDIQIHRRADQEYTLNRESIRYRQASFVEHLLVHKDNPLKLEIRHLIGAVRSAQASGQVELPEAEDLRSLAVALEIERMIRDGRGEIAWPKDLPWSVPSA
jgi:predicted dehydrogenase